MPAESQPSRMGHIPDFVTRPSSPPIYQTTAFDVPDLDVLASIYSGEVAGHIYTRDSNPNHSALAESIAIMEGAEAGAVFSSGMGALASIAMTLAQSGSHALVSQSLYGHTLQLAGRLQEFGVEVTLIDACDKNSVAAEMRDNTRFCLIETISNPLLEVADIPALCGVLGQIPLVVDSTFTTPELIQPIRHGAAIVVHSASKYLNGHGDVMLGVAAGTEQMMKDVNATASIFGQNANPFECWLTQRGLRTLPLRMQQITRTTEQLASFLSQHPLIRRVYHPSLKNHDTHQTAVRDYPDGCGGIVSFELNGGGQKRVSRFMQAAHNLPFSPTLADARTTLSHPAATSHRNMTASERQRLNITDELVRLSVGLEPFETLQAEISSALESQRNSS